MEIEEKDISSALVKVLGEPRINLERSKKWIVQSIIVIFFILKIFFLIFLVFLGFYKSILLYE